MAWTPFPYPAAAYRYTPDGLKAAWSELHRGDAELFPSNPALQAAWIACHAGDFEQAARIGLDIGVDGYAVAHKASCTYATYLENSEKRKLAMFEEVAERCERQQIEQPDNAAGYFWHAYALGRFAQGISVVKALAQGLGAKVRHSLDRALTLAPGHADAHIVLGTYHVEIIDKVGAMVGGLTYGVKKDQAIRHFEQALALDPESAIARIEYARGLAMLDGKKKMEEVRGLYLQAAACPVRDASERLDAEAARLELEKQWL